MSRRRRVRIGIAAAAAAAGELRFLRRRGYGGMGRVIVRCRQGHLFTTIWIPGVSVKAVRLGAWRLQRCPVGRHWSLVSPVPPGTLSEEELLAARAVRDLRLP